MSVYCVLITAVVLRAAGGRSVCAAVIAFDHQSVWPKSVTHVTGTFCNPCLRAGPNEEWRALGDDFGTEGFIALARGIIGTSIFPD
jgi:hypothetical protein